MYYDSTIYTYRKSYDEILLRCLSCKEAQEAIKEAHDNTCGAHWTKTTDRLQRLGYYWPKIFSDAMRILDGAEYVNSMLILCIK